MTGAPSSRLDDGGPAKPSVNNRRTSVLLREYIAGLDKPYASLGDLRDALGDRGFGVLMFIFALPNLMPVNSRCSRLCLALRSCCSRRN